MKNKIALELIQNTLKVAVLKGDRKLHDLVEISYYNLKLVYFSLQFYQLLN